MSDLADEIPQRAYINAQIVLQAIADGALNESKRTVCHQHGYPVSYEINNPALHVSLLYCLIVFPKEFWDSVDLADATRALNSLAHIIIPLFDITCWPSRPRENEVYNVNQQGLISKIRNAVAHAHISVDRDMNYQMWDQRDERSPKTFECRITAFNLGRFLEIVGSLFANVRSPRSRPHDARPN